MSALSLYARGANRVTRNGLSELLPVLMGAYQPQGLLGASTGLYNTSLINLASQISVQWNSAGQTGLIGSLSSQVIQGTTQAGASQSLLQGSGQMNYQLLGSTQAALSNQSIQNAVLGSYHIQFHPTTGHMSLQGPESVNGQPLYTPRPT